ncbi:hypothetical protein ACQJBY_063931 [Aegilops geniculata]
MRAAAASGTPRRGPLCGCGGGTATGGSNGILGQGELPPSLIMSPRSGTPDKLLGREDASMSSLASQSIQEGDCILLRLI